MPVETHSRSHRSARSAYWRVPAAIACLAGLLMLVVTPPFESPDEQHHVNYANYVLAHRALPNQAIPEQSVPWQGHQAPLYYVGLAAVIAVANGGEPIRYALYGNPEHSFHGGARADVPAFLHRLHDPFASPGDRRVFYLLRLISVAMMTANVALVAVAAHRVSRVPRVAMLAAATIACLPQFASVGSAVSNDGLANLLATATVVALLLAWRQPARWRYWLLCGLAAGLGGLAKKTVFFLYPALTVAVLILALLRADRGRVLGRAVVAGALAVTLLAPMLIRNQLFYGDLLGESIEKQILPTAPHDAFSVEFVGSFLLYVFPLTLRNTVDGLSWLNVALPPAVVRIFAALAVSALVGVGLALWRRPGARPRVVVLGTFVVCCVVAIAYYYSEFLQSQGRYLFAVAAPAAGLVALGWREFRLLPRLRGPLAVGLLVLLSCMPVVGALSIRAFFR